MKNTSLAVRSEKMEKCRVSQQSQGPELHFDVIKLKDGSLETIQLGTWSLLLAFVWKSDFL